MENYQGLLFKKIYQFMIVKQFRKKPAQEHIWNNPIKILQNLNVTNLCLHTCYLNSLIGKPSEGRDASTPILASRNQATTHAWHTKSS